MKMTDPAAPEAPAPVKPTAGEVALASPAIRSAARWFWWIAGLSLVNVVLFQTGSKANFVLGLGVTALADAVFANSKPIGFVVDAIAIGFFLLMGSQAARGRLWAFYVGLAVYALDALIYVTVQEWMPVAFHALALFFIARGALSLRGALQKG
jgi:hypothetical protein